MRHARAYSVRTRVIPSNDSLLSVRDVIVYGIEPRCRLHAVGLDPCRVKTTSRRAVIGSPKRCARGSKLVAVETSSPLSVGVSPVESSRPMSSTTATTSAATVAPATASASLGLKAALPRVQAKLGPGHETAVDLVPVGGRQEQRLEPEPLQLLQQAREAILVLALAPGHLAPAEANRLHAARPGIGERDDHRGHGWEALLPGRVLDDHGHDLPGQLEHGRPHLRRRRREKVGQYEDEAPGGQRAPRGDEMVKRLREVVLRRLVLGPEQMALLDAPEVLLAVRRPPERLGSPFA